MLGGFSVSMDGRSIAISRSKTARYAELLMLLLVNPRGLSRSNVISELFDRCEVADAGNSLNNLIHEARAKLRKAGIPVKSCIENRRNILRISDELLRLPMWMLRSLRDYAMKQRPQCKPVQETAQEHCI